MSVLRKIRGEADVRQAGARRNPKGAPPASGSRNGVAAGRAGTAHGLAGPRRDPNGHSRGPALQFEFASGQIQGKRAAQEDTVDVLLPSDSHEKPGELCRAGAAAAVVVVVADGMGGHVGGRIASNLSSKYFLDAVNKTPGSWGERLDQALIQANDILRTATEKRPELDGMGSTLVGAVVNQHGIGWVSIGDSGLYLFRDHALVRLNEDHSFGAYLDEQVRQGLLAPEHAAMDRRRNQLFHALLGDPIDHYERFAGFRDLRPGDAVLLASDGLKTLSDETVGRLIAEHEDESAEQLVVRLLEAVDAENRERQDNTSVILVKVRDGVAPGRTPATESSTTVPLNMIAADVLDPLHPGEAEGASSMVDPTGHRSAATRETAPPAAGRAAPAPVMAAAAAGPAAETGPEAVTEPDSGTAAGRAGGGIVAALLGLAIGLGIALWLYRGRLPPWPF